MSRQLSKQLESMVGKTFQYGSKIHYVIEFTLDDVKEKFTLKTNMNVFERTFEAAKEFLSYWEETNTIGNSQDSKASALVVMEQENSLVDKLTNMLLDNITKVQADPKYIPQAQTVNNNVNSIINLTKLKLDVLKHAGAKKR